MPSSPITPAAIRAWWSSRQGLDGSLAGRTAAEVLERAGWSRSVGGSGPYLALFARAGLSRQTIDAALASLSIHELPSARGCTYVVPASDYALALRAGQGRSEAAEISAAKKHLGVTDSEINKLCEAILKALSRGPLDPRDLKEATDGAVRNLGEAGKKRGITTTLSLGLGKLQASGDIRRVPTNGRIDQQRYSYALWSPSPARAIPDDEVAVELARRFFRWTGPATLANFAWWSGLPRKTTKAAAASLALVPLAAADDRLLFADDLDALRSHKPSAKPQISLVGSLDNLSHLRRDVAGLVDAEDSEVQALGEKGLQPLRGFGDLPHHAILDRGRLIGFWEYEVSSNSIVYATFQAPPAGLAEVIARTQAFVRDDLGDARSFSLDSPESRTGRIDALRGSTKKPKAKAKT